MLRYNANSRLFKYTTEEKKRYKLYKKKKMWVVAGMSLFSTATLVNANASADELSTTAVATDGTQKAATQSEENKTNDETLKEEVTTENKASEKENDITENKASEKENDITENKASEKENDTTENKASEKENDITENKVSEKETDAVEDKAAEQEEVHVEEKLTPDVASELTNSEVTTELKQDQAESVTKERPKAEPQTDRVEETKASAMLAPKEAPLEAANETLTAPTSETETSVSEKDADKKEQTPQIQGQEVISDKAGVISNASDRLSRGGVFRRVGDQATKETISLLATPASAEPQADGASIERSIKVSSVTKGTQTGILSDPKKLADNSTEYILTSDIFVSGEPKVGMTVTYTGKNGDTFSMRVVPGENTASDYYNNPGYEMRPSGNPIKEWKDGSYLFTWTITGAPENVSVARTQTIPAVPFFRENTSVEGNYKPYISGSDSGILKPGASYSLKFFINGQAAPADTTVKFVADKILKIKRTEIDTDSDASSTFPIGKKTANKTTDTNYVYQVKVGLTPLVSGRSPYIKTAALNYSVPVPEHFLLDVDATTEYLNKTTHRNYSEAYRGGSVKVTQPGGEGTPILIETKGLLSASSYGELYLDVPFVGRYTSTETNGRSDIISGWFDLGDGQKHYFGKVNIDTNEALNDPEYLKQSTGFRENILPKDATEVKNGITIPAVHENYYVRLWYSSDDQQYMITNHVSSDYSYVKREGSTHIPAEIKRRLPALEKGDPSAPLLYAVGLGANGLTEFKPTYHFDFPDEITSTGIVMPLNNVTDDYADYKSYNPAQPGYTVVVTGNDGSKITQRLLAGESYNPITGSIDHFGNFSKGEKLAEGVKIAAYDVTPDKEYYASAYLDYYSVRNSSSLNDITTGYINILGYLNTKAQSDVEYISNVVVESANKYVPVQFKTKKIDELKLPVIVDGLPMSSNNGNQQTILNLNDTYSIQLRAYGVKYVGNARVNLDAGGALQGKPNKTATDLPGHALNIPFGTVKDPIVYLTVPNQMTIENISGTNQFYEVYGAEGSVPKPQITRKQNLDGQVVYILDWTGTGFELSSKMSIIFNMRVKKQGLNDFDPAQTAETLYAYEDVANKKTLDLYTEQQLKAKGVSIEGLKAYKPNVDSTNNTSWLQISGDLSETTLLGSYKTKMTFADGTSADTMMLGSSSNRYYLRIIAPVEVRPAPLIKGTKDAELGITGVNYPVKDYYEVDGKKVGLQELQLGMVNNTADPLKGVISVMNLPQVGEKDGNDLSSNATEQGFTLNISEQGKLAFDPTNNNAKDAHTLYYSTSPVTLSSDGTTLRFANGTVWTRGQALPSELLTAQQVTDWSTIKALVMYIPSLSEGNQILYHFNAYSPTSETNMSKRVKLLQVGGYEKQASLVMGDVTDSYATYATLRIVDQAGNQINGYKEVRGQAILDPDTHEYVVENKDLFGEAGKALVLDPPATITGYKFVQNNFSSTVLQADGSTVVTRSYQVDRARVLEGSLSGPVLAEATGDPQANTGNNFQADPTGVSEITFNLTDAQLARKGYKYKITVVDRNNKELVDKNGRTDYDTLAEALEAHGMFDNNNDRYGATQNFIVNYIGNFQKAVIISQNDPAKEIPMSVNEAGVVSPYYSDGQSGQVMFYNEDGAPLISDNTLLGNGTPAFKRQDYRYTVTAPDGTTYSSIDKAMGAKLKFDNTENDGEVDRDIQVYRIDYVKDLQNLRLTIIDDEGDLDGSGAKILVDNVELGSGLSESVVDEETKTSYASWIKRYTDQGYVVVRQDELPTNYDNDPTVDQTVVVHLKHGTEEKAGSSKTLVQRINYVYESGVKKGEEAAPRYSKAFTFTSVDTIDKVTKKVIRTVWSPDQTAPVVVSPTIKGYDLSRSEIQQIVSVDSTDSELTHTVLYYPEIQTLNVKIIDDTLGETIIQGTLATGYTNAELPASVYQQYQNYIDAYTNAGYVLVSKDLLPANFDEDSTVDQEVVVHLKHGTKQEAGVDKTVTQTITYVYGNGPKTGQKAADDYTKAYVFTSVNTLDAVTGEVLKTTWSPAQETTAVTSPTVAGYVADKVKVASQSVSHDTSDLNEVVTYTAGDQTVKVHYIDVYGVEGDSYSPTSGTELKERLQTLTGEAEASYTNTLWDYAQAGYELVQAQPEATAGNFDTDPSTDQNYYVYLTHAMKQVAGKPVTITQMINYVYGNGPRAGQKAADSSSKAHTFTPTYTVDQVTKQNVGEPVWTPENAEFSAVVSPTIAGYTPDKGEIEAITITPSSENSEHTVYYNANQQKLTYTVIDDGDGNKVLVDQSQLATGDSDSVISASVLQAYQNIINSYQKQGYVLVSADSLPANFDNNDEVDQNVVIHLNHGTKQEAGVDKTVTQTITYVYGNGPKTGQKAADDYTKAYVFTSVNTLDAVTGEVLKTTWSPAQETTAVTSPTVAGYVADKVKVASQSVSHDTSDLNEVVTYTAGDQTVKVHYIDVYGVEGDSYSPTSGTELKERLQTLTGEAEASYTNTLWDYAQAGYELVQAQPEATAGNFDTDPSTDQNYYVYLTHAMKQVAGKPVTITQMINYVYGNGPRAGQKAADSSSKAHTFTPTYTVDQVTKQNVGEPVWTPENAEFSAVVSPTIAGYTPDKGEIEAITITPSSENSEHTVYYNANQQKLTYTVIDDGDGNKVLVDQSQLATGDSDSVISASVLQAYQNIINGYQKQGYVLVSADSLPANFDNNDEVDQNVVIHLNHGTKQEAGVDKTVTQTITYVYGNGPKTGQKAADDYTKAYVFTSVNTLDAVTGEVLKTTWSPAQETTAVTSPTVAGYVADKVKVASQSVSHDTSDLNEVVTYTAGDQTVKVHYIDVYGVEGDSYSPTSGTELKERLQTLTGEAEASYTNTLWDYAQAGYELVQAQPEATAGNFDTDPSTDQNYYVYLTHAMKQVAGKPVTITQMINYVYGNGPRAGQKAADSSSKAHTFTPTYTVDQVTKQNVGEPVWTPENAEFSAVVSPTIAGYTPDKGEIEAITITPSSENSEHTVYYNANQQKLTYTVIDDGDGNKVLVDQSQLATGDSDSVISASVLQAYQNIINSYQKQGYVLVSADSLPANFDNNDEVDQNVVIHLNHGTKQEAGVDKTVTQTITYVYGNGPKTGQKAADDYTKAYVFTSVNTLDAVTGEVLKTTWSPAQETTAVTSPTVAGYVADKVKVASQSVSHDTSDLNEVVTYTAGDQTVKVHYIDVYGVEGDSYSPTSGTELKERLQTLTGEAEASYTNTLWDYAQAGYELVQAQPEATAGNFDTDPSTDQNYYVYLTHAMKQVAGKPVTITQMINYVYGNGPRAGQKAADSSSKAHTFTPTYTVDQVTKQNVGEPVWTPENAEFSAVVSPTIAGYTPDKGEIEAITITPSSENSEHTVYYNANQQKLTYTVIDDGDGNKVLVDQSQLATGDSDSVISASVLQAYQNIINGYQKQGYVLVSADSLPANFDNNDEVDQNVVIHLNHGTKQEAGVDKTVTQTITYVYGNGPKTGQKAADDYTKAYVFTSVNTLDAVTGEVLKTTWSPAQETTAVTSPTVAGYVADKVKVASQSVSHDTSDLNEVVTYTAGDQTVKVHYIDVYGVEGDSYSPTSGTELKERLQTLTGEAEASYTNTLWDYAQAGYELVQAQPEATAGNFDTDPSTDQNYYVYLTHAMKQVAGKPVTITQMINYVYGNGPRAGQKAADSSSKAHTFTPTYTVDQVTKQNVGEPVWTPENAEFSAVVSPTIAGYTPDKGEIEAITITPSSENSEHTVYYNANQQKLTYTVIDDGDGNKVLVDQSQLATGDSDSVISVSVLQDYQNIINGYQKQGYVLVSADNLPANFDNNDEVDQNVVIHLNHGTKQEAGTDKTVTQTITYVYGNGPKTGQKAADDYTKAYVFTSVNTLDAVTGEVLRTTWSPAQETTAVTSPTVAGYVADKAKVASQSVSHDTSDLNEVVTYTAGDQTVKVHYIDVYGVEGDYSPTSGTELKERLQTLTGEAEASYTNTLWDYAQAGYELVQAQPEATAGNFDTDPSTDQNYYVYLTHAMKQVAGKPVTITQMINYVYGNGPRAGQKAADSSSKAHTFTPTYTVDQVTKQNVGEPVWTPENAEFSAVVSPTIAGYTPDKGEIEAITITPSSENSEHTVYYNANQQKLTYTVIDDGDGNKVLVDQSQLATGDSDSVISASVLQAYQNIINGYQKQGYVLVSADNLPANFDNNDEVDQNVVIHLNHGTKQEAGVDKTVTQTITYVYGNGPKTGQKVADDYTKAYVFTSVNTLDAVTGEVLKTTWSPAQETTAVTSPTVAGYVADKAKVASQSVSHDTSDLNEVVTYTAGDQTVKVHYIDVYGVEGDYSPTSGTELKERLQTLTGEAEASYTNTLWDYAQAGYELVQAQPEATAGNFDTDPSTDQNYYVYLTHAMKQVEGTPVKVSRTINYIYRTGSKAGQPVVPKDKIVKVFIPTYMIDQVTKQTVGTPTWSPDKIELEQVSSPSIAGYTPDKQFVESAFITPTSDDIEETVYYDAEIQNVTYTIIDNTEDKVLVADEVLTRGESGTNLTVTSLQEYQQIIEAYRQKGYEIVKHDILPASFDSDSTVDQNVQIRVVHGMFTRAGADKQVTQTINYVYGNGPAKAMPAAPSYTKTYIFTSEETVDKVTGKVVRTVWSPVQSTSVVESPSITGYVADKSEVSAVQVKYDTADMEETISYYAGEQLVNIHYIDINGKDITTDILPSDGTEIAQFAQHLTGEAGADYTNQLSDYLVAGYELVYAQKEATAGTFDEDPGKGQDYYVYLKHGTETLVGTSVTIKDTINYIYGNGPHVGEPVVTASVITRTFIPTYTVDKVTGETIETVWSGDGTIDPSVVPTIAGYTPDRLVIAGRVLTPDMQDQSQTVYYTMTEEPTTPSKVVERSARRTHVEKQAEKRSASFETGQKYDEMQIVSREVVEELPQTGDEKDKASLILGLGLLSGATLLGTTELGQKRRKKKRD